MDVAGGRHLDVFEAALAENVDHARGIGKANGPGSLSTVIIVLATAERSTSASTSERTTSTGC